jgi:hypothetical protein
MACPKCQIDPAFHSFTYFGTNGTTKLFYTAPARANDRKRDIELYKPHLTQTIGDSWIWVLDCAGMGYEHCTDLTFSINLFHLISDKYEKNLQGIYIIHPNLWIKTLIRMINSMVTINLVKKMTVFNGSNIEIYASLGKKGLDAKYIQWLLSAVPEKPLPPVEG